jgi:hypothetical protein
MRETYLPGVHPQVAGLVAPGRIRAARKYDSVGDLRVFRVSGGIRVFVDQAAQDRFSVDLSCIDVGHGGAGSVTFIVGTRWAMP